MCFCRCSLAHSHSLSQIGSLNQNMSLSPFNIGLFLPPSPSPTSGGSAGSHNRLDLEMTFDRESAEGGGGGRDEGFAYNDSLGMLSTVAVYHSELSGGEGIKEEVRRRRKDSGTNVSVGDGMARMRLESSSGMKFCSSNMWCMYIIINNNTFS